MPFKFLIELCDYWRMVLYSSPNTLFDSPLNTDMTEMATDEKRMPHMTKEWHGLTRLMQDALVVIEWIRLIDSAIAIESSFELLLLASLSADY
jgi:hypothetical protein